MSKTAKQKWCYSKCKFHNDSITKSSIINMKKGNEAHGLTNESFSNLTDSLLTLRVRSLKFSGIN